MKKLLTMIIYILVALSISVTAFINLSPQFGSNPTAAQKRLYANYSNYENGEFQNIILKQNQIVWSLYWTWTIKKKRWFLGH